MDKKTLTDGFTVWFAKRFGSHGRIPNRTAWHFFDYMAQLRKKRLKCIDGRKPVATELMRLFRQDCIKAHTRASWKNAVAWYLEGRDAL